MNQNETAAYVRRIQDGDPEAFDAFYEATSKRVYFICISFLKNEHDAKDAMQETYLTAFRKLDKLREAEKAESWLERIAVNKCRDFLKRNAPIPTEDEILEVNLPPEEEPVFSEEYITNTEKRRIIMEILRTRLSDLQYQTVILYYFNELSVRETAEVMECSEGAVKNRLSTARRSMKKGIEEYEKSHETKLHAGVPLLTLLLQEEAKSMKVPDFGGLLSSEVTRLAGKGALKTAGRTGVHMITGKLIAGAAAAVIAAGGSGTAAVLYFQNHRNLTEPEYHQAAIMETIAETNTQTEASETETMLSTETPEETTSVTTEKTTTTAESTAPTIPTTETTATTLLQTATPPAPVEPIAEPIPTESETYAITKENIIAGYQEVLKSLCNFEDWETYGIDLDGATFKKPFTIDYYLCDMTHNGIPELAVVCSRDMMTTVIFYYTFDENGARCLYSAFEPSYSSGLLYDTQNKQLVLTFGHFGIYYYSWLAYEDGKVIVTKQEDLSIIREDKAGTEDYYDNEYWNEWEAERHLKDNHFSYSVMYDTTTCWEEDENGEIVYTEIPGFDFAYLESYPF